MKSIPQESDSIVFFPAFAWWRTLNKPVSGSVVGDSVGPAVKFEFTTQPLGNDAEAEHLTERT
jgi:hypothetical protein